MNETGSVMGNSYMVSIRKFRELGPEVQHVLEGLSPDAQDVMLDALRDAYRAGQEESDARTGRLMARIFGGFVGVTPGIDLGEGQGPRERMRSMLSRLSGRK